MLHVSTVSIALLLALESPARRNARIRLRELAERLERQRFGIRRGPDRVDSVVIDSLTSAYENLRPASRTR